MSTGLHGSHGGAAQDTSAAPQGDPFSLDVLDGMIRVQWRNGIVVDSTHAAALIEQIQHISRRCTLPMLAHLNEMESVSRRAMQLFAQDLDVAAMAVVGPSPVDRTISDFFIRVHTPAYPVRHFTTTEPALSWLKGEPRGTSTPGAS